MLNVTQENITGSNVFVDTIAPTISINGNITKYYLLQNRTTDLTNATATDGDRYNHTYAVTSNITLEYTRLICIHTLQIAGNLGASCKCTVDGA